MAGETRGDCPARPHRFRIRRRSRGPRRRADRAPFRGPVGQPLAIHVDRPIMTAPPTSPYASGLADGTQVLTADALRLGADWADSEEMG